MKIQGKELIITLASFAEAMELHDAVAKAAAQKGAEIDVGEILEKGKKTNTENIFPIILSLISSSEVRDAVFLCARRATYDNEKVTRDFFDEEKNRGLFYPIIWEIIKVNLAPFLSPLIGELPELEEAIKTIRKHQE